MSADLLRRAAAVLGERAEGVTPGAQWTMHPGVGQALADWLDDVAAHTNLHAGTHVEKHALTVARAVLGESS